ncbi:hypothetical protein JANAI62_34580 [Jannaschia pagri]|uniref:DUF302 domain-containing protein n=1 Tax=Jannaschia pagri TaxID=2829797 RepID=A0ABQ4NR13_9RHOB|nr:MULTISPECIES: DUF302 domain-containing protein [unclassified Jannaschia]GIT93000.1 hypothetical protein JANAI61_34580 [Jannaschia sp. AI_61]GIT96835.1 hypothetical protein JANAI62_34580 [Jannaschia sp. AI_62]
MIRSLLVATLTLTALPALAQQTATAVFDGEVEDAAFAVESAILGQGLVIDYVSHVGDMLSRTGHDLGLGASPVGEDAQIFVFCSATISRQVMEADPMNIVHCPYGIFVAEIDGATLIGHRVYGDDSMAPVNALLQGIIAEALE